MKCLVVVICLGWLCRSEIVTKKYVDLTELGRNITETIKHPTGEIDDLLSNIYKYYEALEIMHSDMKKGVQEAKEAFYELKKQGGPSFLNLLPVNEKPLVEFYKWKTYHGIEFRGFLRYNVDEWEDMNMLVNKSSLQT